MRIGNMKLIPFVDSNGAIMSRPMTTMEIDRWAEQTIKAASDAIANTDDPPPPMAVFLCYGSAPTTPPMVLCGLIKMPALMSPVIDIRKVINQVSRELRAHNVIAILRIKHESFKAVVSFESMSRSWSRVYRVDDDGYGEIVRRCDNPIAITNGHWLFDRSCIN